MYESFSGETHVGIALAEGRDTIKTFQINIEVGTPLAV
jgi:hypothetical protein